MSRPTRDDRSGEGERMSELLNERIHRHNGPVHGAFGLTYASYLIWPRALMEEMPLDWQERFVTLLDEFWDTWDRTADVDYAVQVRGEDGRFRRDPLADYRHASLEMIDALRRKDGAA